MDRSKFDGLPFSRKFVLAPTPPEIYMYMYCTDNTLADPSREDGPLLPAWYIAPCTPGQHDYKGSDVMNPYYKLEEWKLNGERHINPSEWLKPQLSTSMLSPSKDGGNNIIMGIDQFDAGNPLDLGAAAADDTTTTSPIAEVANSGSVGFTNLDMGPNSFLEHNSPVADEASVSPGNNIKLATQRMGVITFGRKRGVKRRRNGQNWSGGRFD